MVRFQVDAVSWLQWVARVLLLMSAGVLTFLMLPWLDHPLLWFGLFHFVAYGVLLFIICGVTWRWHLVGSMSAIAYGTFLVTLGLIQRSDCVRHTWHELFAQCFDLVAILLWGTFTLGGILGLAGYVAGLRAGRDWLRWMGRLCLLISVVGAVTFWSTVLAHPGYGVGYFVGYALVPLLLAGAAWVWRVVGGLMVIIWGTVLLWTVLVKIVGGFFLPLYGLFALGGMLTVVSGLPRKTAPV